MVPVSITSIVCCEMNCSSLMFFAVDIRVLTGGSYCQTYCSSPFSGAATNFPGTNFDFLAVLTQTYIYETKMCFSSPSLYLIIPRTEALVYLRMFTILFNLHPFHLIFYHLDFNSLISQIINISLEKIRNSPGF